jgi:hypothetical protein
MKVGDYVQYFYSSQTNKTVYGYRGIIIGESESESYLCNKGHRRTGFCFIVCFLLEDGKTAINPSPPSQLKLLSEAK